MEKKNTIYALLMIFVVFGTISANVYAVASNIPISITKQKTNEKKNILTTSKFEIDDATLEELEYYFKIQSNQNSFKIKNIMYSSGLLIESENTIIIIGHGCFDSNGLYHIADYSSLEIAKMIENKEIVALLACYSDAICLNDVKHLTYSTKIDLESAMQDLTSFLGWSNNCKFIPSNNINLNDLDPGGNGGVYIDTTFFNDEYFAYTYHYYTGVYTYWDLRDFGDILDVGEYLATFQNDYVFIVGSGDFTIRYVETYFFGLITVETEEIEYHEFKSRVSTKYEGGELIVYAYDLIVDETYTDPYDRVVEASLNDMHQQGLPIEDFYTNVIRGCQILMGVGTAFFGAGIAVTVKYGAAYVITTILGFQLTAGFLTALGLVIIIVAAVLYILTIYDQYQHTFIIVGEA